MRNRLYMAAVTVLSLFSFIVASAVYSNEALVKTNFSNDSPDVIIDAGHGGIDGGAVGVTGAVEKDINLEIALRLRDELQSEGLQVLMIRSTDISIHDDDAVTVKQKKTSDLKKRLSISSANPDSILISIHQNSFTREYVHGTMLYYGEKNGQSRALAECIKQQITLIQPQNDKQLKKAGSNLFLISNSPAPAILVECGFLTNREEEALLKTEEYRNTLAGALADGIIEFLSGKIIEQDVEQ